MQYNALKTSATSLFNQVRSLKATNDQRHAWRLLIGIKVLGKLKPSYFDDLMTILLDLIPSADPLVNDFAGFVLAKFCRTAYMKDVTFLQTVIAKCGEAFTSKSRAKPAMAILVRLAKASSSLLKMMTQQFVDTCASGLFHRDVEMRELASKALKRLLSNLRKMPMFTSSMKKARALVSSRKSDERHSFLLVFTLVAKFSGSLLAGEIDQLLMIASKFLGHKDKIVCVNAMKLLVTCAPLDPFAYRTVYEERVRSVLFANKPVPDMVKAGLRIFDIFPDTLAEHVSAILDLIVKLFALKADDASNVAFSLILKFMETMPLSFAEKQNDIVQIISRAPLNLQFLKIIPILHGSKKIWKQVQPVLAERLSRTPYALKIIAECPPFEEPYLSKLFEIFYPKLKQRDRETKRDAPKALARLRPYQDPYFFASLLTMAVEDDDPACRLAVIQAFEPGQYENLVFRKSLSMIHMLANDEVVKVRKAAIMLLHELVDIDPCNVLPIFRRLIVDALMVVSAEENQMSDMNVAKVLPVLFSCSERLLPIYVPVFIHPAMSFLSQRTLPAHQRSLQQSFFEREYAISIARHYLETITLIFRLQPALLDEYCIEIMNVCIKLLDGHAQKGIILAILNSLVAILDYKGLSFLDNFPSLPQHLFTIGSKASSIKVHTALFRVLGKIGGISDSQKLENIEKHDATTSDLSQLGSSVLYQDWYLSVICSSLLSLLDDDSPVTIRFHAMQVLAVSLNPASPCIRPHFDKFVGHLLSAVRTAPPDEAEQYFALLQTIISQHTDWLKPFAQSFSDFVLEFANSPLLNEIMDLVPVFVRDVKDSFAQYMPKLVSTLIKILVGAMEDNPNLAQKILFALSAMTPFIREHVLHVVQKICERILDPLVDTSVVVAALNALQIMIVEHDCSSVSSQLFRVCKNCLKRSDEDIKTTATVLLSALGSKFEVFKSRSSASSTSFQNFEEQSSVLSFDNPLDFSNAMFALNLNENVIVEGSYCRENMLTSQWKDWLDSFVLCVIDQSPSQVIKSCLGIAQGSRSFALKIFHAAFLSCWTQMSEYSKTIVCNSFVIAFNDTNTPLSVLATVVGLAEFMERIEHHLSIPYIQLAKAADKVEKLPFAYFCADRALLAAASEESDMLDPMAMHQTVTYAKALHVSRKHRGSFAGIVVHGHQRTEEVSWKMPGRSLTPEPTCLESDGSLGNMSYGGASSLELSSGLVDLSANDPGDAVGSVIPASPLSHSILVKNQGGVEAAEATLIVLSQLEMYSDMRGVITSAGLNMTPRLAEHLHDWGKAVKLYSEHEEDDESFLHLLRAYQMSRMWTNIAERYGPRFHNLPATVKGDSAVVFAEAFFQMRNWRLFDEVITFAPKDSLDSIRLEAIADLIRGKDATEIVERGFEVLALGAGPLFAHGYSSVLPSVVVAQQLTELQEFASGRTEHWSERTHTSFHLYRPLSEMRILLTNNIEEARLYVKMARHNKDWESHDLYCSMFSDDPVVQYEHALTLWKRKQEVDSLALIRKAISRFDENSKYESAMKQRALRKEALLMTIIDSSPSSLLKAAEAAEASSTPKGWSLYARIHTKLYTTVEENKEEHAIKAIEGYLKNPSLPEAQQMASVLFRTNIQAEVLETVSDKLMAFSPQLWLKMLPQICFQLGSKSDAIRNFSVNLLRKLIKEHHHRVLFAILFECMFGDSQRIAHDILLEYEKEHPDIVHTGKMFYEGLLSLCKTKSEEWLELLTTVCEALKRNDTDVMHAQLDNKLFELEQEEPQTDDEIIFRQKYQKRITAILPLLETCYQERTRGSRECLYNEFITLFNAIRTDLETVRSLTVADIAPTLTQMQNIDIAIPGTYVCGSPVIRIASICSSMVVFHTKQRPKRIGLMGSDGIEHVYLLKGREDLRLDERAMQFFDVVNSLIQSRIMTYFVLPLSKSGGLIQWLHGADTISKLICEYRSSHGMPADSEFRKVAAITHQGFDSLRPIQRLEALLTVSQSTSDTVLSDIMWLKSTSPENWLRRVKMFSETSALMSIVGYIIGLGDRHPSNLMIQRETGTVIHIDLGDCFEVTRNRLLFPELIPFRLTRFIVRTLGPGGVNGLFKRTCCDVMKVIRRRYESILAVLEIFAYSPISTPTTKSEDREANALKTINRICDKVNGNDFEGMTNLGCREQVAMLIKSATDPYNFAHSYRGWNPLW